METYLERYMRTYEFNAAHVAKDEMDNYGRNAVVSEHSENKIAYWENKAKYVGSLNEELDNEKFTDGGAR